jgi:hypothetical protein
MGNRRTRPGASFRKDARIAVETHCLTKAGRHGRTKRETRVAIPAAPGSPCHLSSTSMQIIERLRDLLDERPDAVLDEFVEVEARMYTYIVAFDAAVRVKRDIDRFPQPEWIEFIDQFGARQVVRSQDVVRISESTPKTRAAMRAFVRARQTEEKSDEQAVSA